MITAAHFTLPRRLRCHAARRGKRGSHLSRRRFFVHASVTLMLMPRCRHADAFAAATYYLLAIRRADKMLDKRRHCCRDTLIRAAICARAPMLLMLMMLPMMMPPCLICCCRQIIAAYAHSMLCYTAFALPIRFAVFHVYICRRYIIDFHALIAYAARYVAAAADAAFVYYALPLMPRDVAVTIRRYIFADGRR